MDATTHKIELKRRIRADSPTATICRKYSACLKVAFLPGPTIRFNLKSMSGTRADLHQNGHKRFRNVFQKWDFQSGSDVNKTRKVSTPFLPQPAKFSAQKRRIAFSGFYAGKNGINVMARKLFSEFLGIKPRLCQETTLPRARGNELAKKTLVITSC